MERLNPIIPDGYSLTKCDLMIEERLSQKITDIEKQYQRVYSMVKENSNAGSYATLIMLSNMKHTLYQSKEFIWMTK